jgi:YD repeat-containing protein
MQTTTTAYDAVGRVTAVTDPNRNTTTYTYDTLDRLTSESIVIDSQTLTRSYQYFAVDNIVRKTDRNGRVTRVRIRSPESLEGRNLVRRPNANPHD